MKRSGSWMRAVLVLAGAALALMPAGQAEALAGCAAIGGSGVPCTVPAGTFTVNLADCPININSDVIVSTGAKIVIPGGGLTTACTINVTGDFTMQPGSIIDGSTTSNP